MKEKTQSKEKKGNNKNRMEVSEVIIKKTIEKINENKRFNELNKTVKPLSRLIRKKEKT